MQFGASVISLPLSCKVLVTTLLHSTVINEILITEMKFLLTLLMSSITCTVFSQQADTLDFPSNSFENSYRKSNMTLKYSYDSVSQTHNYSNNWDFDKDGINDEVYFVGTGGAHLYYFLKIVLSTDHNSREFEFIQSDFPLLTATDTINFDKLSIGFVVTNFNTNLTPSIIVRLDEPTFYGNKELKKRNLKTKNIIISFENGETKYGCL